VRYASRTRRARRGSPGGEVGRGTCSISSSIVMSGLPIRASRRRSPRRGCAAGWRSPSRRRSPRYRSPGGWERGRGGRAAPGASRRSWEHLDGFLSRSDSSSPPLRHPDLGVPHRRGRFASTEPKFPCPSIRVPEREVLHHAHEGCVDRVVAVRWYLPITSPTMRADFLYGFRTRSHSSCMAKRMRRWTGLRPSRTSGRAAHDHAHRVIEVALAHLVLDARGCACFWNRSMCGRCSLGVADRRGRTSPQTRCNGLSYTSKGAGVPMKP